MLFAWSVTEVIRYSFYAFSVLGIQLDWLNYLRFVPPLLPSQFIHRFNLSDPC